MLDFGRALHKFVIEPNYFRKRRPRGAVRENAGVVEKMVPAAYYSALGTIKSYHSRVVGVRQC